jgi:hypothetical protein
MCVYNNTRQKRINTINIELYLDNKQPGKVQLNKNNSTIGEKKPEGIVY